jgi:hypothetical protein
VCAGILIVYQSPFLEEVMSITREKLALQIVEDMDMDDLFTYAVDRLEAYFDSLSEEEFQKEAEEYGYHWEDKE